MHRYKIISQPNFGEYKQIYLCLVHRGSSGCGALVAAVQRSRASHPAGRRARQRPPAETTSESSDQYFAAGTVIISPVRLSNRPGSNVLGLKSSVLSVLSDSEGRGDHVGSSGHRPHLITNPCRSLTVALCTSSRPCPIRNSTPCCYFYCYHCYHRWFMLIYFSEARRC